MLSHNIQYWEGKKAWFYWLKGKNTIEYKLEKELQSCLLLKRTPKKVTMYPKNEKNSPSTVKF